ncbi:ketosteroid isomerase family protein [Nocardia sp. BMG51109]|uniref:nuclear transport factor 2 family protein n=1 Tax=Nocardia sp. BMG51109 TaxID=1056816 RepID=UPI0004675219|nr:ketosteroid isomerase family protein [Nocardia sp. BMG51109]
MPATAAELLAAVERSPQAVAVHDRAAWVGLFTADARVEDPVGSRPAVGRSAIGRFYDTFIAPNTIAFEVEHDIVCGATVYRDLAIETSMSTGVTETSMSTGVTETSMSTGVTLRVPMHLRYDLAEVDGRPRIRELHAHWELPVMVAQLLAAGTPGLTAATKLVPQLLGNQGVGGALGFARGFARVGASGKRAATGLLRAAGRGDGAAVRIALAPHAELRWGATPIGVEGLLSRSPGLRVAKPIAAGRFVTATVTTPSVRGIAEIEMARGGKQATAVRVFVGD